MRVNELGEFGLIRRIASLLPSPPSDVVVGIGDDVAVLQMPTGELLLATCDAQVEGVHFVRSRITPYQLGKKIVAINVSDIASMGGTPMWALVSLVLPSDMEVDFIDDLYRGMHEQIESAGAFVVGGNLSKTKQEMVIDFSLLGRIAPEHLVLRRGAKEGDHILVTGALGDSKAGLELMNRPELIVSTAARRRAEERHFTPTPRLREGQVLGRSGLVHAMADVSDGLMGDIVHICRASRTGAEIWAFELPIGSACNEVAALVGQDPGSWALTGGEDYELLFTASPDAVPDIQKLLLDETGTPCTVVGRVTGEGSGILVCMKSGEKIICSPGHAGWDHFSQS
jgi:thiamine-monophosphate kinase